MQNATLEVKVDLYGYISQQMMTPKMLEELLMALVPLIPSLGFFFSKHFII